MIRLVVALVLVVCIPSQMSADIFRWDNQLVIRGTEGITPGPNLHLVGRDLTYAGLEQCDLRGSRFDDSTLTHAFLGYANLTGAGFRRADLTNAIFEGSTLADADFREATLTGAALNRTTSYGFSSTQLYSSASYQAKSLPGIRLSYNTLQGWDFHAQDLAEADFEHSLLANANFRSANLARSSLFYADLTGADFTDAIIAESVLSGAIGFTQEQLYSTASYKSKSLAGIALHDNAMDGWNFEGQDLTNAWLGSTTLVGASFRGSNLQSARFVESALQDADLSGADIRRSDFRLTTQHGLTAAQIYATASYANKSLQGIQIGYNDLSHWELHEQDLTEAQFTGATLQNANLNHANMSRAVLDATTLTGASFSGARIDGASLVDVIGFTQQQMYATINYQEGNLQGIRLAGNDMSGWDFAAKNLTNADLGLASLENANFQGANLEGASFYGSDVVGAEFTGASVKNTIFQGAKNFSAGQLYSTASYQAKSLQGIQCSECDLVGWSFKEQDLTGALLENAKLGNADLTGAVIERAFLAGTTQFGFSSEQLYSTESYQSKSLRGVWLGGNELASWNFQDQDLTGAYLQHADLRGANLRGADLTGAQFGYALLENADFTDAIVAGAVFNGAIEPEFAREQLYSTASYRNKNLRSIILTNGNMLGWDFRGQDLTDADVSGANLSNSVFAESRLTNARLSWATLMSTSFQDAEITGADLSSTTPRGFTSAQLYSTASYRDRKLGGVKLMENDLSEWQLAGQDLRQARFDYADLSRANLSGSDLTRASFLYAKLSSADLTNAILFDASFENSSLLGADLRGAQGAQINHSYLRNVIWENGEVSEWNVLAGETFLVRNYDGDDQQSPPTPAFGLTIRDSATLAKGSQLKLLLDADDWNSTIYFAAGTPVNLEGLLNLEFSDGVHLPAQVGRSFQIFDWSSTDPPAELHVFSKAGAWDTSQLLTEGIAEYLGELVGNTNADDAIDLADLNNVRNHFGASGVGLIGDVDADGYVSLLDLNLVRNNFGNRVHSQQVPEPPAAVLATLLLVGLVGLRRYGATSTPQRFAPRGVDRSGCVSTWLF